MLHYGASRHPLQAYVTRNLEVSAEIKIAAAFFIYVCHVNSDIIEGHGGDQTKVRLGRFLKSKRQDSQDSRQVAAAPFRVRERRRGAHDLPAGALPGEEELQTFIISWAISTHCSEGLVSTCHAAKCGTIYNHATIIFYG